jgi:transmembrane sensor
LEDGSRLVVNSNSLIRVEMSGEERRVQVLAGEGLFDVAKDRARPFVVVAGRDRVEAVGTRFSVWRRSRGTRVVVREGVVKLQSTVPGSANGISAELSAGSIADITAGGLRVRNLALSDIDALLDWRSGYVTFIDATLDEAAEELNRHNARKIIIADPAVAALQVGGRFRASSPDRFASVVEQSFGVRVEYGAAQITLHARD